MGKGGWGPCVGILCGQTDRTENITFTIPLAGGNNNFTWLVSDQDQALHMEWLLYFVLAFPTVSLLTPTVDHSHQKTTNIDKITRLFVVL